MGIYEHTTREDFKLKVYERLGDNGVFWPEQEINSSIEEALLVFGAISNFWREEISFKTEENKRLYDMFSDVEIGSEFIYPSYTYEKIVEWINKDIIENISVATPNSEFISLDEIVRAIETRYNLYKQLTSLVIEQIEIDAPPNQNIIQLPDTIIDIVRVTFTPDDGIENVLNRSDEAEIDYFDSNSLYVSLIPNFYTSSLDKTKVLNIYPAPSVHGKLRLLFVGNRNKTIPLEATTDIKLPNNLIPYLKYGVEADIFGKEGVTQDLARAAYCIKRWEEGIMIGLVSSSVIISKANGRIINADSIMNVDLYFDAIKVRTSPTVLGFAGYNMFSTDITPSDADASINLLVVANAKIPIEDDEFIQVDHEYINPLIDYVVHISKIKSGAAELAQTANLLDGFIKTALNHNERLQLRGLNYESLVGINKKEETAKPRVVK